MVGVDEAKAEVEEIVEFLKNPHKFTRLGGKMTKGESARAVTWLVKARLRHSLTRFRDFARVRIKLGDCGGKMSGEVKWLDGTCLV